MSNFSNYRPGIGQTGAYLVAGKPYMTGSTDMGAPGTDTITFPSVTRKVTVKNTSAIQLFVHFANTGNWQAGLHVATLPASTGELSMEVRCSEVFVSTAAPSGSYEVFAELTGIESSEMFVLTGSVLTD